MEMKWKNGPWHAINGCGLVQKNILLITTNTVVAISISKQLKGAVNPYMSVMKHQIGVFAWVGYYSLLFFHI